jgi:hypothetical protein
MPLIHGLGVRVAVASVMPRRLAAASPESSLLMGFAPADREAAERSAGK